MPASLPDVAHPRLRSQNSQPGHSQTYEAGQAARPRLGQNAAANQLGHTGHIAAVPNGIDGGSVTCQEMIEESDSDPSDYRLRRPITLIRHQMISVIELKVVTDATLVRFVQLHARGRRIDRVGCPLDK